MSFRLKIIVGILSLQAFFLVLLIWNGLSALKNSNEEGILTRAATTSKLFASTTQAAVLATDLASLDSYVNELISNTGIEYARVISTQGVLAEGGDKTSLARKFVEDSSLLTAESDGVFDASSDIFVAGKIFGRVEIGFSTKVIQTLYVDTRNSAVSRALLSLTLMGLLSWALGYYLTRGLNALQLGTKQIAGGDLSYQIKVEGSDELAQTALAFNEMTSKLKHADTERAKKEAEIQQLNQVLEQRVIERTMQLQDVNTQLEHQAMHDALTKLPNRALFHDRLHHTLSSSRRSGEVFAVVGMDLDLFKEINDTLGHHAGDMVLQHVAISCSKVLRETDTLARMGGDEFTLLLPRVNDLEQAVLIASRVLETIKEPLKIGSDIIDVGASLGIALYPKHGEDELALITHSDAAMYEAKQKKLGVVVYEPRMGEGKSEAIALKADLRRAISEGEMVLHFQPKIDFSSHTISGVEALVRWEHPRLGLLYPDTFIGLAEMSGLIKPLTYEVLRLTMRQILAWKVMGHSFPVAVNISAINLQEPEFPEQIAKMIEVFDVPSALLELEVTETAIMNEPIIAIENIKRLSNMGVQVSIDDFGTGYSSMAYIQKLLVAKIKIDKSFVMEMGGSTQDEIIVRSTIDLAHNLGLKAVAEGVEDQEAWNKLREMGCDSAQGYFMSKPLTAENFMDWILCSPWSGKAQASS